MNKHKINPCKYVLFPNKYSFIIVLLICFSIILYLFHKKITQLDFPNALYNNIAQMVISTNNQKGSCIDIYVPYYLYANIERPGNCSDTINVTNNTLTLLPGNKVLYLNCRRVMIFDFNRKIAYSNRYLPIMECPLGSPKFCHDYEYKPLLLPDGKVYLFGEEGSEAFDSKTNKFYPISNMLKKRTAVTATLLPDETILIIGGDDMYEPQIKHSEAEIYDPKEDKYTAISNMHTKRAGHTATLLKNGKVLVVGGNDKNKPYAELYDFKTKKFYPLENYSKAKLYHSATLLPDGKVIIIGGIDELMDTKKYYSEVEIFDPQTNTFQTIGHLISPIFEQNTILLKSNKILIVNGQYCGNNNCSAQIYDLNTNKASFMFDYDSRSTSAIMLKDGSVLIVNNNDLYSENIIRLYNP